MRQRTSLVAGKSAKPKAAPGEDDLAAVLASIEHQFGKGAITSLDPEDGDIEPIEVIDTGSLGLNRALGVGGLPRGRIIEIYGPESSGKTGLSLCAAGRAQLAGGRVAVIDAEHALDAQYARNLGVSLSKDKFLVNQPDTGEQGLEIAETLVRSGTMALIIIDSVAALTPKAEIEGEMGDSHVGLQARLMSQALRKLAGACHSSNTTVIFINQLREKIGVMFGSPETTTGGKALKFYASIRLDVRRIETLKSGDDAVGNRVRIKVVKNKCAPPARQAELDFYYASGISRTSELIDFGVQFEVISKSGAFYSYDGTQLGQGREKVRLQLEEHPEIANAIELKVAAALGSKGPVPDDSWEDPPEVVLQGERTTITGGIL
jgi:recombination protein RecA